MVHRLFVHSRPNPESTQSCPTKGYMSCIYLYNMIATGHYTNIHHHRDELYH